MLTKLLKFIPILIILALAGALSSYWLTHKPRADRLPPKITAPLVAVITPQIVNHQTTVAAMGTVVASESVNLTPRISGMVIRISPNFIEGGLLKKDEEVVELDPTDYLLSIKQSENDVAKAQFNLKLEQGQQAIVKREYQLLGADLNSQEQELVLRRPHLNAAKAALAAAEASLKLAHLNLQRTRPSAPFNAIILSRNANVGAWMSAFSTGTPLAKLAGTDTFWINVAVAIDKLKWLDIPDNITHLGSPANISYLPGWGKDIFRQGHIKRLLAEIEPEGRMARLIVEVNDPLCLLPDNKKQPRLMLGTYVQVNLIGKTLSEVIELPETSLHNDQQLWLLSAQNTLILHKVEPLWTEQGKIYLDKHALPEQTQVIVSDLATPVAGMTLRRNEQQAASAKTTTAPTPTTK